MASGGARGNAGRVADPNAFRRDRAGDDAAWIVLDSSPAKVPAWPLEIATERELAVWERLWSRPQASEWLRLGLEDEVALYARYFVEAEQPEASGSTRTLVKQHQELLGLSTAGLKRLHWVIPAGDSAPAESKAPRRASSRSRLKVVGNDG